MNPYEGSAPINAPINVPHHYDSPGGGGMPPAYPPYQPPPGTTAISRTSWMVLGVVVLLVIIMGGWYAWGSYQKSQAKKIPLYPGAHLIPSSVFEAGSG